MGCQCSSQEGSTEDKIEIQTLKDEKFNTVIV